MYLSHRPIAPRRSRPDLARGLLGDLVGTKKSSTGLALLDYSACTRGFSFFSSSYFCLPGWPLLARFEIPENGQSDQIALAQAKRSSSAACCCLPCMRYDATLQRQSFSIFAICVAALQQLMAATRQSILAIAGLSECHCYRAG